MSRVAISGASGQLGSVLRRALLSRGMELRSAGGSKPLVPIVDGEDVMHGDLRDPSVVDRLLDGVEVLIHLAGTSVEKPLAEIIENNLRGLVAHHKACAGGHQFVFGIHRCLPVNTPNLYPHDCIRRWGVETFAA